MAYRGRLKHPFWFQTPSLHPTVNIKSTGDSFFVKICEYHFSVIYVPDIFGSTFDIEIFSIIIPLMTALPLTISIPLVKG